MLLPRKGAAFITVKLPLAGERRTAISSGSIFSFRPSKSCRTRRLCSWQKCFKPCKRGQFVLAIEMAGSGFHEAGSKQAERDMKKNSVLEKCAVPFLRLRTDGSGEKEKIRTALKGE